MLSSRVFRASSKINVTNFRRNLSVSSAKVLRFSAFGKPENVLKLETEKFPEKLNESDVLVEILASPINPADLNKIEGTYGIIPDLPAVAGGEAVGRVVEVGSKVSKLSVNDVVVPFSSEKGTWRSHGIFSQSELYKVPEVGKKIDREAFSALAVNPSTAYRLLNDFGDLKSGDVVIQNGATSMVGTSLIQLAHAKGIKTVNIIRERTDFPETVEKLKRLGAYIVVSEKYSTSPQFKRLLSDLPKPKVAYNCVGGQSATEMIRHLGPGGTLVTYGGMSRQPVIAPTSSFIFKDVQLKGFWMTRWYQQHSVEEREAMWNELVKLINGEKLRLYVECWPFDHFGAALKRVQEPWRGTKICLTSRPIPVPKVAPKVDTSTSIPVAQK